MSASVHVSIHDDDGDAEPKANVYKLSDGKLFASVDLGRSMTFVPPGRNEVSASYCRRLAAELSQAADKLEKGLFDS